MQRGITSLIRTARNLRPAARTPSRQASECYEFVRTGSMFFGPGSGGCGLPPAPEAMQRDPGESDDPGEPEPVQGYECAPGRRWIQPAPHRGHPGLGTRPPSCDAGTDAPYPRQPSQRLYRQPPGPRRGPAGRRRLDQRALAGPGQPCRPGLWTRQATLGTATWPLGTLLTDNGPSWTSATVPSHIRCIQVTICWRQQFSGMPLLMQQRSQPPCRLLGSIRDLIRHNS